MNVDARGSFSPGELVASGAVWVRCVAHLGVDLSAWLDGCALAGIKVLLVLDKDTLTGDPSEWPTRMAAVRDRYAGRYSAVQPANESDHESPSSWTMSPADYSLLLKMARLQFGDDAYIVAGGLASGQPWYLDGVDLSPVNAIGVHPYGRRPEQDGWEETPGNFGYVHDLLDAYAAYGKPLWVTEIGVSRQEVSDRFQALYAKAILETCARRPDTEAVLWFAWHDSMVDGFGLIGKKGGKKDAYRAFAEAAQLDAPFDGPAVQPPIPPPPPPPSGPTPKTKEEVIAISNATADEFQIPRLLLLGCGVAESNLVWDARRPRTAAQDAAFWMDVSGGVWQQTVRYDPDYRGGDAFPGAAEIARVLTLQYDVQRAARVAAGQLKRHWQANQGTNDAALLQAMARYNYPAGYGAFYSPDHEANYRRGLKEAHAILDVAQPPVEPPLIPSILDAVLAEGRKEIGKRYAGPVIGEPDSYRWGNPGWDCSSFVSGMYQRASGGAVKLTAYTDAAINQVNVIDRSQARPGDIVFFKYADSSQPGVAYPHMGLYYGDGQMLDAQFPAGVGIHPLLNRPTVFGRPRGIVVAPPETPDQIIARLERELAEARGDRDGLATALAHVCDKLVAEPAAEVKKIREQFLGPKP